MSADPINRPAEESGSDLDMSPPKLLLVAPGSDDEVDDESDSPPRFAGKGKGKARVTASPVPSGYSNDAERLAQTAPAGGSTWERQANTAGHQQEGAKSVGPRDTPSLSPQDAQHGFRGSRDVHLESSESDMDSEIAPSESEGEAGLKLQALTFLCGEMSLLWKTGPIISQDSSCSCCCLDY